MAYNLTLPFELLNSGNSSIVAASSAVYTQTFGLLFWVIIGVLWLVMLYVKSDSPFTVFAFTFFLSGYGFWLIPGVAQKSFYVIGVFMLTAALWVFFARKNSP